MTATLEAGRVVLGCGELGGRVDGNAARRLVADCLERGVRVFDTASVYGAGGSEECLGRALSGRRHEAQIITKLGGGAPGAAGGARLSREAVLAGCERSLRRLRTDYVDVLMAHQFDRHTPLEETVAAFCQAVREGKARAFGVSNFSPAELARAVGLARAQGQACGVYEGELSLASRHALDAAVVMRRVPGARVLVYSVLSGGLLVRRKRRQGRFREQPARVFDSWRRKLAAAAARSGFSSAQLALAWAASRPGVTGVVVGPREPSHLGELLAAPALLPPELESALS